MPRSKVPADDLCRLAGIYNKEGSDVVRKLLKDRYGIRQPLAVIRRMKGTSGLRYEADQDRFMIDDNSSSVRTDNNATNGAAASGDPAQSMNQLIQGLISERLLELSRYVTLSPLSRTLVVDKTTLEANGYRMEIR